MYIIVRNTRAVVYIILYTSSSTVMHVYRQAGMMFGNKIES